MNMLRLYLRLLDRIVIAETEEAEDRVCRSLRRLLQRARKRWVPTAKPIVADLGLTLTADGVVEFLNGCPLFRIEGMPLPYLHEHYPDDLRYFFDIERAGYFFEMSWEQFLVQRIQEALVLWFKKRGAQLLVFGHSLN